MGLCCTCMTVVALCSLFSALKWVLKSQTLYGRTHNRFFCLQLVQQLDQLYTTVNIYSTSVPGLLTLPQKHPHTNFPFTGHAPRNPNSQLASCMVSLPLWACGHSGWSQMFWDLCSSWCLLAIHFIYTNRSPGSCLPPLPSAALPTSSSINSLFWVCVIHHGPNGPLRRPLCPCNPSHSLSGSAWLIYLH